MEKLLQSVIEIAQQAGQAIVKIAESANSIEVQKKADKSPVTIADLTANDLIVSALQKLTPDIPIISEEGVQYTATERLQWPRCWLVDPLDGTRGFIDGSGEYTVNIALIEQHEPVLGVIYAPQLAEKLYYATRDTGAFVYHHARHQPIQFHTINLKRTLRVAVSQYHRAKWLEQLLVGIAKYELVRMNSSVKICLVAEGVADIYPRLGPTSEWDTAAGQCIIEQAGGVIVDLEGQALTYNARTTLENPGFMVIGDPSKKDYFVDLIQRVRRNK